MHGQRVVGALNTSKRVIQQQNSRVDYYEPVPGIASQNESDSNTDTYCLGNNFIVLSYTNRAAGVYPYNDSYEPISSVPIVNGASTYTITRMGNPTL